MDLDSRLPDIDNSSLRFPRRQPHAQSLAVDAWRLELFLVQSIHLLTLRHETNLLTQHL
jgi:hypothetical protein